MARLAICSFPERIAFQCGRRGWLRRTDEEFRIENVEYKIVEIYMLTYQLQKRFFNLQGTEKPTFPAEVEVKVNLGPGEILGTEKGLTRACIMGGNRRFIYNANTGRLGFENRLSASLTGKALSYRASPYLSSN